MEHGHHPALIILILLVEHGQATALESQHIQFILSNILLSDGF
jgi:hypothetical protein